MPFIWDMCQKCSDEERWSKKRNTFHFLRNFCFQRKCENNNDVYMSVEILKGCGSYVKTNKKNTALEIQESFLEAKFRHTRKRRMSESQK